MNYSPRSRTLGAAFGICLTVVCLCLAGTGTVTAQQVDIEASELAGSGTADDPYVITTVSELQAIEDDPDAHYELANDIDASETSEWNNGAGFAPIGGQDSRDFSGHFDGNNHTITNLTIDRRSTNQVGLFGKTESGETATIESVHLSAVSITGNEDVGALVGEADDESVIQNASVSGTVTGHNNVGGLVGEVSGGAIRDTFASGSVTGVNDTGMLVGDLESNSIVQTALTTGTVTGADNVGGVVGASIESVVTQSASTATVTATGNTPGRSTSRGGGLVGGNYINSTINQSYATGSVEAVRVGGITGENFESSRVANTYAAGNITGSQSGGVVGGNFRGSTVTSSYWDEQATGQADSAGSATGLTTAEMTGSAARENMNELDFDSNWTVVIAGNSIPPTPESDSYPILSSPDPTRQLEAQNITTPAQTPGGDDPLAARFGGDDGEIGNLDVLRAVNAANSGGEIGGDPVTNLDVLQVVNRANQG